MIHEICQSHSAASRLLAQLRNVQRHSCQPEFRRNLQVMGTIFGYEISKYFQYRSTEVETPLGMATCQVPEKEVVLATILRAGLPMHQGMLDVLGGAESAFVAARRLHHKDGTFEVSVDYVTCPDLDGKILVLCDPMLATGSSLHRALEALHEQGTPAKVHLAAIIAARFGVEYMLRLWPTAHIWVGTIDEELTAKSYIVPGLGDAGDLAYGGKRDNF